MFILKINKYVMLIIYIKQSSFTSIKESQAIRFLICDDADDWVYIHY
jgi:hypothetical protein